MRMTVSIRETESKYDVPAGARLPRLDGLAEVAGTAGPEEQRLKAEYFDTEDLRLMRAGITLRRRTGGTDAGWHLKLPAGPQTRTEIRLPPGRAGRRVPAELSELVRARTRGRPLVPVATITTRRQLTTLLDQDGHSLAEVADDAVTANQQGDPVSGSHWRELEVELTGGDRRLLAAADKVLRRDGLRPAGRQAKLERVLGDRLPARAERPRLTAVSPASEVVSAYLSAQAETLESLDPLVRRGEPDALHQMRVTTRRLRTALRAFPAVVSPEATVPVADELRWLGGVLGAARDAEVQAARMRRHADSTDVELLLGPVQARLQTHFAAEGGQTQAAVSAALNSERYSALLAALDAVAASPPPGPAAQDPARRALTAAVRRAYRKAHRRIRRAGHQPAGPASDVALHQARKGAKQARYAAEAAGLALGADARRFGRQMKKVQSVLGDHQDTVVARHLERALAIEANQAGEIAFSYGLFYERDARAGAHLRARSRRVWRRSSRARYRRWLAPGS
jgi:CHAD domain-containing protein